MIKQNKWYQRKTAERKILWDEPSPIMTTQNKQGHTSPPSSSSQYIYIYVKKKEKMMCLPTEIIRKRQDRLGGSWDYQPSSVIGKMQRCWLLCLSAYNVCILGMDGDANERTKLVWCAEVEVGFRQVIKND